jgi:hypothetical protein
MWNRCTELGVIITLSSLGLWIVIASVAADPRVQHAWLVLHG